MNKVLKKVLVVAMALTMSLSTAVPAFAADSEERVPYSPTAYRAMKYFDDYSSSKYNISADSLIAKVKAHHYTDMYIIDIRDAADYEKGHIKGAVNIPYSEIDDKLENIPNDKKVYVYCYSGQTASQTMALLRVAGKDAYNVSGGWGKISAAKGIESVTVTRTRKLTSQVYPVMDSLEAAIAKYYDNAVGKYNISPAAVKEGLANGSIYLLDVRSAADHAAGHIAGVDMNIPFGLDMQESFSKLPKDQKIVVQCYSGQTASQTVAILRLLGYDAWNMSGGTGAEGGSGWLGAGYQLVK